MLFRSNPQEKGLRVFFALDEGSGSFLHNTGSVLLPDGANKGAAWSSFAVRQKTTPHEFTPSTRQVTLNPSVTSVDQVDFTDRSTCLLYTSIHEQHYFSSIKLVFTYEKFYKIYRFLLFAQRISTPDGVRAGNCMHRTACSPNF